LIEMRNGLRLGVLASGRGSNLQALMDAHEDGKILSRVAVVISDVARARAVDRARAKGIAAEELVPDAALPSKERRQRHEADIVRVLEHYGVELVVLAGYMRLVSADFCRRYERRIINVHPSLLPAFPGLLAQRQAVEWGARVAGCTTHFVDEATDHGPIILQAGLPLRPEDDEDSLSRRILQLEHQLLPRTVHLLEEGRLSVEGRRVRIDPGQSWRLRYATVPDAFYGHGY